MTKDDDLPFGITVPRRRRGKANDDAMASFSESFLSMPLYLISTLSNDI
jgi:hypothetical protein